MDNSKVTYQDICGKWNSPEFGDFIIFGNCDKYYISFHEKYKWGKMVGEIKYFIWHIGNGEFYFTTKDKFFEIWYNENTETITLKLISSCKKIK